MKVNPNANELRKDQTDSEKMLWSKLRNRQLNGIKFRRQQTLKGYIVDFVSFESRLIIELDGGNHKKEDSVARDNLRTNVLQNEGFTMIRFWNGEIHSNLNEVLEKIRYVLLHYPSPNLSPKGRGNNMKNYYKVLK